MSDCQTANKEKNIIEDMHLRQLELADLLQTYGLLDEEPDVDWAAQQIKWEKDEFVVTASTKQLCRYSPTYKLLTIPTGSDVQRSFLPTRPEYREESNENGAWLWALEIAHAEKAQYVYRLRQPHVVLFVGLWELQVQNLSSGITQTSSTGDKYLLDLLQDLRLVLQKKHQDTAFVSRLFSNHAEAMLHHAQNSEDEKDQLRLGQIGKRLQTTSNSLEASFSLWRPFLRSPLSERQVEQLNRELSSIEADILSY